MTAVHNLYTKRGAALAYHSRSRTLSHRDLTKGLSQSASVDIGNLSVDLADRFPDRNRLFSFACKYKIEQGNVAAPSADFCVLGDTKINVDSGDFTLTVNGTLIGSVTVPGLADVGVTDDLHSYDLMVSVSPGNGKVNFWVNGDLAIQYEGAVLTAWSSGTAISYVSDTNGIVNKLLTFFNGQLPRCFS